MSNSPASTKMQDRVSAAIETAKDYDSRNDTVLRDHTLLHIYEIPGASIAYVDAALVSAGFEFAVPENRRK